MAGGGQSDASQRREPILQQLRAVLYAMQGCTALPEYDPILRELEMQNDDRIRLQE